MSKFLNNIDAVSKGDGYWKLNEPLHYQSDLAKATISVPSGFETNLYTGIPDGTGDRAAVVHDYLYVERIFPRVLCDKVFLEAMLVDGVPSWRAYCRYVGVCLMGGKYY